MNLVEELNLFISQFKIFPSEKSFQLRAPKLLAEILEATRHLDLPFKAKVSLILLGVDNPPKCFCGGEKVWSSSGWKYCSLKCVNNSPEVKGKKRATCQKNFGVDNPSKSPEVIKQIGDTLEKNFGVRHALQVQELRTKAQDTLFSRYGVRQAMLSKELKEKQRETCFRNYGVFNPGNSEKVKSKYRATCKARYGVSHPQTKITRSKALATFLKNRYPKEVLDKLISKEFWNFEYIQQKKSIDRIASELKIYPQVALTFFSKTDFELRTENTTSSEERELREFLESSLGHTLTSLRLPGNRSIDFYIPELKLAFEYNGIYWHSEKFRDPKFHLSRTLECEGLGIRLIHIWSDDWMLNRKLMEKKIKSLLGLETQRVFARKCKIVVPTIEQKIDFYTQNHIKGDGVGSVSYALEYLDKIVALITYKNMGDGIWDLNRYATSCSVVGGFSRLMEHFKKSKEWNKIYTFADRSWSMGEVYLKNGFSCVGEVSPAFYGIEKGQRKNRRNYIFRLLNIRFPNLKGTQLEIMDQAKIPRIWDCGQLKFELNKEIYGF